MRSFSIAGKAIGPEEPCFIIAEAGCNHNGDTDLALKLVDIAADAGADAVKFQTFRAESLASPTAQTADYQMRNLGHAESQLEMLKKLELPYDFYPKLITHCHDRGIIFLSSPFDEDAADFLERFDMPAFKIPSGEIINLPYLRHVATKRKPMIVSTGMATMAEVAEAIEVIRSSGNPPVCLLQCYSDYPSKPADQNLRVMSAFQAAFGTPAGFSDHTKGYVVTAAAVALGACIIEKHFTLDCSLPGPDHRASLEPPFFAEMIRAVRAVEESLGSGIKEPLGSELNTRIHARKSIVARFDIPEGKSLSESDLLLSRPGTGLAPAHLPHIIGRRARHLIPAGTLLTMDCLA